MGSVKLLLRKEGTSAYTDQELLHSYRESVLNAFSEVFEVEFVVSKQEPFTVFAHVSTVLHARGACVLQMCDSCTCVTGQGYSAREFCSLSC